MSVEVEVFPPAEAEKLLGAASKHCNLVMLIRRDFAEDPLYHQIMQWVRDNDIGCQMMPCIIRNRVTALYLMFSSFGEDDKEIRRINDEYMRFKLTFAGHTSVKKWTDNYEKCQEGNVWDIVFPGRFTAVQTV